MENETEQSSEGEDQAVVPETEAASEPKKKKKNIFKSKRFWLFSSPIHVLLIAVVVAWGFPYLFIGFPGAPKGYENAGKVIAIDLERQSAYAYEKGKLKERCVVLTGKGGHETPTGKFAVTRKIKDYVSKEYGSPMPYSVFFDDGRGIAMHYSFAVGPKWCLRQISGHHPLIGSHGCVRMTPWGSMRMYKFAEKGTPVIITNPLK